MILKKSCYKKKISRSSMIVFVKKRNLPEQDWKETKSTRPNSYNEHENQPILDIHERKFMR